VREWHQDRAPFFHGLGEEWELFLCRREHGFCIVAAIVYAKTEPCI
jgi:hypothetical protein